MPGNERFKSADRQLENATGILKRCKEEDGVHSPTKSRHLLADSTTSAIERSLAKQKLRSHQQ
jgi:hypothetical protein